MIIFFFGQWPRLNLFRVVVVCTEVYLTQAAQGSWSAYLELLLSGAASLVHMILASSHQISAAHRGYTQAVMTHPQAVQAPCPTFQPHPTHSQCSHTNQQPSEQTQGTQPFMQTLCNARTPCIIRIPPPCHTCTPLHNVCAMF